MCGDAQVQNSNFINKVAVNLDKAFSNMCENQFQQIPVHWIIKGLEPCKLAFGSVPCHGRFALSTGHRLAENHADAHFPVAGQEFSFVIAEKVFLASERNYVAVVIKLNELNRMGWQLNLPYVPQHSDFLKNVRPEG